MELYYSIINILDYMALHELPITTSIKCGEILDSLASMAQINITDIADANNCELTAPITWDAIVLNFRKQHKTGERLPTA